MRRLLLFDTFILSSTRLREVPSLVEIFGFSGLLSLLESGALRIQCEAITMGQTGQTGILESRKKKGILPLGSYNLNVVNIAYRQNYISQCLQIVHKAPGLNLKQAIKLKRALVESLVKTPDGAGNDALQATLLDLHNTELLQHVTSNAVRQIAGIEIPKNEIVVTAHRLDEEDFRLESNLSKLHYFDDIQIHKILENSALAIGSLNLRIEQMRMYNAISGVIGEDLPILGRKLDFLAQDIAPQFQEQQFSRVIEIAGLPDISADAKIDAEKLLHVRESRECREFRHWLQGINTLSDDEIREHLISLKSQIDNLIQSGAGKFVRFLTTTAIGFIPGAGMALGPAASALDMFLADKVFSQPGPAAFINRLYPSIFEK